MDDFGTICDSTLCCGCGLCQNICPVHAISMKEDGEFGHKRPTVDLAVCIHCGKCERACPANTLVELQPTICTYAAWQKDDVKHYSSSSGGIAAALYEKSLDLNLWIAGVSLKENMEPAYVLSNKSQDITRFKRSKYVQAEIGDIYNRVLEKLKQGQQVLFIGLPCHCAAIKRYTEKYADNIYIVDLVCHGVPSFSSLKQHIMALERKSKAKEVRFRDQFAGECLELRNENNKVFYKRYLHEDVFMHSFISGDLFAESCYNCRYACSQRVGDMTICDFWGLGAKIPFNKKVSRVSAVLLNTEKGKHLFNLIQDSLDYEGRETQEAIDGNDQLRAPSSVGENREKILRFARDGNLEMGLQSLYGQYADRNYRKRIVSDKLKSCGKALGLKRIRDIIKG